MRLYIKYKHQIYFQSAYKRILFLRVQLWKRDSTQLSKGTIRSSENSLQHLEPGTRLQE